MYLQLRPNKFLICNTTLEENTFFAIDYKSHKIIKSNFAQNENTFFYKISDKPEGKEVFILQEHLHRPTSREPLIRALYALVSFSEEYRRDALILLDDNYLSSLKFEDQIKFARECIFCHKYRGAT